MHPRELKAETQTSVCGFVFTAASFTMAERRKPRKRPSAERANTPCRSHTTRYSSASGKKGSLTHATARTNLETVRGVKPAIRERTRPARLHSLEVPGVVQLAETGRTVVTRGWGQNREPGFHGCGVPVLHDEDGGDGCTM